MARSIRPARQQHSAKNQHKWHSRAQDWNPPSMKWEESCNSSSSMLPKEAGRAMLNPTLKCSVSRPSTLSIKRSKFNWQMRKPCLRLKSKAWHCWRDSPHTATTTIQLTLTRRTRDNWLTASSPTNSTDNSKRSTLRPSGSPPNASTPDLSFLSKVDRYFHSSTVETPSDPLQT